MDDEIREKYETLTSPLGGIELDLNKIVSEASRCTQATCRAFGIDAIPKWASGVLQHLKENGYSVEKKTLKRDITLSKLRRFLNLDKSYYIRTNGHAMACIRGHLVDTMRQGWNSRKVEDLWEVQKKG